MSQVELEYQEKSQIIRTSAYHFLLIACDFNYATNI